MSRSSFLGILNLYHSLIIVPQYVSEFLIHELFELTLLMYCGCISHIYRSNLVLLYPLILDDRVKFFMTWLPTRQKF